MADLNNNRRPSW